MPDDVLLADRPPAPSTAARRDSQGGWSVWASPLGALAVAGLEHAHLLAAETAPVALVAALLLIGSVFAAVHHAEVVAQKVGEPFGSILLALAVTAIETSLIVASMLSGGTEENSLARDAVFSVVLIVLNGVVGLCVVIGAVRYREQTFRVQGVGSALSVLATLAVLTLVLPNFTVAKLGPQYSPTQLMFVGALSLILYGVFVFVQSVRHRDHFLPEPRSALGGSDEVRGSPSGKATAVSAVLMLASLAAVVLLAETLSGTLERAIHAVGLPPTFLGVVIASLVLLPESVAALKAAYANRAQTSLNLALGSALASIGLTIPVVGGVSLYLGRELTLGLDAEGTTLLLLTLFVSTPTLATGRATILQGAVHLVIFAVFLLLAAVP
jgi:Ca2+:H+ antiporter